MRRRLLVAFFVGLLLCASVSVLAQEQPVVESRVKPILEIDGLLFRDLNANGELDPYEDWRLPIDERVDNLVSLMTLEEKAGQMVHPNITVPLDGVVQKEDIITQTQRGERLSYSPYTLIVDKHITNILNNGVAPPATFAAWSNALQEIAEGTRLGIPIVFSTDPRHGATLGAHVRGTQYFSQWPSREGQYGLAATRNLDLVREFGRVVAKEYRAVGLHMILGPQIDVTTDPRWGRNAGCWSEDAHLTAEMTVAFLDGAKVKDPKDEGILAMVKHWPGSGPHEDGGGYYLVYPGDNLDYHLIPFEAAFQAGATATMSYYSVMKDYDTVPISYSDFAVNQLLRDKLQFDGVVCTDWGVLGFAAYDDAAELDIAGRYAMCINAGVDQFGAQTDPEVIVQLVRDGVISEDRINESVKRILRQPFMLGLFENPYVDTMAAANILQSAEHQALGYQAQLESIVMLSNDGTLPFAEVRIDAETGAARKTRIFVSGMEPKIASLYGEIVDDPTEADIAIMRVAAVSGGGGMGGGGSDIKFPAETMALISAVAGTGVPTVVGIDISSSLVVLPEELFEQSAGTFVLFDVLDNALLDVVFGRFNPVGRLPFELPSSMEAVEAQLEDVPFDTVDPLFEYGFGLSY